jgi:hypothetical protein
MSFDEVPVVQWYTDEETGVRLSVEYDIPEWPRISLHIPEDPTLEWDAMNAAIQRLVQQAGLKKEVVA